MRPQHRVLVAAAAVAALAIPPLAGAASAGSGAESGAGSATAPTAAEADGPWLVWATGEPDTEGTDGAYTYDTELVPAGATVSLLSFSFGDRTRTMLTARGLRPGQTYGTHLHRYACGRDPAAAGPHYQQRVGDPDDPDHANADNEVWLDVRTSSRGAGVAYTRNRWEYHTAPGSVVLHAEPTSTSPDSPGQAGARVACVTLSAR